MKTVAMKVNQQNLVNSLRLSFTNRTTVLSELMQNARRSGATQVAFDFDEATHCLSIIDDGCGIESIETLLTVAESGWNADVVATDHPFGIGFLSALFACTHLTVASKSGTLSSDTADILAFKPVMVTPITNWHGKTVITLLGIELDEAQINSTLKRLAVAFPIPVLLNGVAFDRPHARDSNLDFIETAMGAVYLSGIVNALSSAQYELMLYLQGLPIYKSSSYAAINTSHVIHLDSSTFFARLPDRDKLINEADVVNLAQAVLKAEIEKHLKILKATISAEDFVAFYPLMRQWGLVSLLNEVPIVPREVLREYIAYPVCNSEYLESFDHTLPHSMSQQEIVAGGPLVRLDENYPDEGFALSMFVYKRHCIVYNGGLDGNHWLHQHIRDLNKETVTIELVNETHTAPFEGDEVWVATRFCDAYRIHVGTDVVEISDDALYDGQCVINPKGDTSGLVVAQVSSFSDEWDGFLQSSYENDKQAFSQFIIANTADKPEDAFLRLLPEFNSCPKVFDKSFKVVIGSLGKIEFVEEV